MKKTMRDKGEKKEIGRVALREGEYLVIALVDEEKLDIRIWMDTDRYKGPTKRGCLLYTSPSPRDRTRSRMPSSA